MLENYLKQGVYKSMSKSPMKSAPRGSDASFLQSARLTVSKTRPAASAPVCCAYLDRELSEIGFLDGKPHTVQIGLSSKERAYERNPNTDNAMMGSRGNFNAVFTAGNRDKLAAGLKRLGVGTGDSSNSLLVAGSKNKISIGQTVLRLFLDLVATNKLNEYSISGSDGFCNVIDTLMGTLVERRDNSYRVNSDNYVAFAQMIDLLDNKIMPEEYYFWIEYRRDFCTEPLTFTFAACRCYEDLRRYAPLKRTEADRTLFLRKLLETNFRNTEPSEGGLSVFIDQFLSFPLKIIFSYSHLVRDYMSDQFLTELSQHFTNADAFPDRVPKTPSKNMKENKDASFIKSGGLSRSKRFGDGFDDKLRDTSAHVTKLFRHLY